MLVIPITNRGDWLAMRKMDVTASEVPALFGVSKWGSPLKLYTDKTVGREGYDNASMKAGRIMESAIAAAVQVEHPEWTVEKATKYYRDPDVRIGCTPDYFRIVNDGPGTFADKLPIECKFVQPKIYEAEWQDGPPLAYVLQTLVQIHITGAPMGYIAVMLDNRAKDVFIYDVPRNDEAWIKIVGRVGKFWEDVASGTLPGADYTQDGAALKAMYPADEKATPLDLRGDNRLSEVLAKRENIAAAIKVMKDELEHLDAEVIDKLKGAPYATCNGYTLSYKQQTRKEHTVKASTFSVLRVTKTKEETTL